jgi:hypothetical protein
MPELRKQTRMYTKGLHKILTQEIDLLADDICMALVTTVIDNPPDKAPPEPYIYQVNFHEHEFLSDIVGSAQEPVWYEDPDTEERSYSNITSHSPPLTQKSITVVNPVTTPPAPNDNYKEVMFDCDDVAFNPIDQFAPISEAVVLYKKVLIDPEGDSEDPYNINLDDSPLIAYFGGDSVVLNPNGSGVNLVISLNGLIRWGVGHAPLSP